MKKINWFVGIFMWAGLGTYAQGNAGLDSAIRQLAKEKDPVQAESTMNRIIETYGLDKHKDAETFDVLYGTVAVSFALNSDHALFEKYVDSIGNKFNQTSILNMAASKMLGESSDVAYALRISEKTLALYNAYKNDPLARPKDFPVADWQRFMRFAQYPYYDTHAQALFALKRYAEALRYQKMAFDGNPEEGMPASVERYAHLLELTGDTIAAKQLLLKVAGKGKLTTNMTAQLRAIYVAEKGGDKGLAAYLDSLQKNIQATLVQELRSEILEEKAPPFSLKDISGKEVKLSDYTGRIVVLDLWATWCQPCIASFPAMRSMVEKHPEVVFLFVAVEEKEKDRLPRIKSFLEKNKYPFTVLIDEPVEPNSPVYKIISTYKPDGIPAKYIIDKNGLLRFKTSGFDTDAALVNELEAMFSILK